MSTLTNQQMIDNVDFDEPEAVFDEIDADGDGVFTRADLIKAPLTYSNYTLDCLHALL